VGVDKFKFIVAIELVSLTSLATSVITPPKLIIS
jgi:hypothetical protein